MTDEPPDPTPTPAELPPHPGAPRWVKLMGVVVLLLVALLVVAMLAGGDHGGGGHGPGRHSSPANLAVDGARQSVTA